MSDAISTKEAARRLDASAPTVRALLESGELLGKRIPRGARFSWQVDRDSVERFLAEHGTYSGRRRPRPDPVRALAGEVADLRRRVDAIDGLEDRSSSPERERDDLRAAVITLRDALARTRGVVELQSRADDARARMVKHLLDATAAGEEADALRRRALAEFHEALAGATRTGHLGQLRAEREPS